MEPLFALLGDNAQRYEANRAIGMEESLRRRAARVATVVLKSGMEVHLMQVINAWLEYLDNMNIHYSHSVHQRAQTALQTAQAENVLASEFAKTVVYFNGSSFGLAVVPADQFVNLIKLARVLGVPYIRLATEEEMMRLFPDCELGAMPPFGDACELPVIVDTGLLGPYIAFTLGTHCDVVRMSFEDFRRLSRPTVAPICVAC